MQTDQVLYNLTRRGIEYDLLPTLQAHGIPAMAYSPIEQGRLLRHPVIVAVANRHDATAAQVAVDLRLTEQDLRTLDEALPPPRGPQPLDML